METKHLLDIDHLSGDEYIAGAEDTLSSLFFIEYGDTNFEKLYNQLEFAKDYGNCLCTIYGPITTLSMILGRELTQEERLELVKERIAQGDFQKDVGGFTSVGVDVARRWYNKKYPSDPITTQLVNENTLLTKLTQKNIPLVTSLRANKEFSLDTKDGTMDNLNYWDFSGARYGHCRTLKQLTVFDNYLRSYKYKKLEDLELCMNKGFESRNRYIFIKESLLSQKGRKFLKYMRLKFWNGERPNDMITRFEASRIAMKLNLLTPENKIWNKKDANKKASIFEVTTMLSKCSPVPVYLGTDRNKEITRGEAIEMLP